MRIGLYLGDLRRSQTNSHGIVNHAIGLATSLPRQLLAGEELVLFVSDEIRGELPAVVSAQVRVVDVLAPQSARARLRMDHFSVVRWARACHLDILHFPKGHVPVARVKGTKICATVHDDIPLRYWRGEFGGPEHRLQSAYFAWATLHALRRADHVFTDSEFSARNLVGHVGSVGGRMTVVPSAMSLPRLPRVLRAEKGPLLLHFGSRLSHKRSAEAILWTRGFLEERPEYRLLVTGSLEPRAEELCRHPQIMRQERPLSNPEMADLIRQAVALIFPSTLEGFGLPPVEAACLGTPSVWARSSSLPEVMAGAPGGFRPNDQQDFGLRLSEVVGLPDADLSLLQDLFAERYSWGRVAQETLQIYRSLARPRC